MKTRCRAQNAAGAVLVFALLLLVVAAVTLGGIVQLAATRSLVGAREWEEARQRILIGNSRAMARDFVLRTMFFTNVTANVFSAATSQGGFVLTNDTVNFWTAPSSANPGVEINPFNAMERGGFYPAAIRAGLWDGSTNADGSPTNIVDWSFQVRTRSPIAAGLSLVCHNGDGHSAHTTASRPYFETTNTGAVVGLSNIPPTALTSATSSTNGYNGGILEALAPKVGDLLSYTNVSFSAAGTNWSAVVDLTPATTSVNPTNPSIVFKYVVPVTNGTNSGFVTQVVLKGAPAGATNPAVLVVVEGGNTALTNLLLSNNNTRRVYFTRLADSASVTNLIVSSTNATSWRLGMTVVAGNKSPFSRSTVTFNTPSLTMTGGLRTDAKIDSPPTFLNETDPAGLDYIGDLMMWLEDHRAR